jgi:26S proteasome regulatory subunit N13
LQQVGGAGGAGPKAAVEIQAGIMQYDGKMCTPDRRKGIIVIKKEQGYCQFEWQDATTKQAIEQMMIFEGDCSFAKVKQSEDRVYVLTFKDTKKRNFYWF